MALLGPSVTSSPTLDLSGSVPRAWVPRPAYQGPPVTPVRHRLLCTPRKCQFSPCAESPRTHTHIHAHTPSTDVCVLTCAPANPRDTALFPCCSRPVNPFTPGESPGPHSHGSSAPGSLLVMAPDLRDPESAGSGNLWLRRDLGPFKLALWSPDASTLLPFSPQPHTPPSLPSQVLTSLGGAVLLSRPIHRGSQTPVRLTTPPPPQNTPPPSKS